MYNIERAPYGFHLQFSGQMSLEEMTAWKKQSEIYLRDSAKPFSCLIDMTELKPLMPEVKDVLIVGQGMYLKAGMARSAVIVPSQLVIMQMKNTAKASGIYSGERLFSVEDPAAWTKALAWVERAIEP